MRFLTILLVIFVYSLPLQIVAFIFSILYYAVKVKLVDRLEYVREFSDNGVFEEDYVEIIETIINPSVLPVFFVDVESYIHTNLRIEGRDISDGMQLIISRFHLPPYTKVTRRHRVKCAHRGYYTMNTAVVLTKSITIERTKNYNFNEELYVYPKLVDRLDIGAPMGNMFGDSFTSRRVVYDPFSVSGVRDYSFGDPFNSINFKATARSSFSGVHGIKVNKYDYCSDRVFMIYLNFAHPDETVTTQAYEDLMEQSLSLAASITTEALKNGYKVGFAANCRMVDGRQSLTFPILGGAYHTEELLREMSKIQASVGVSFAALLDGGIRNNVTGAEIFILTAYADESIDDCVTMFKRHNTITVIKL